MFLFKEIYKHNFKFKNSISNSAKKLHVKINSVEIVKIILA